MKAISGKDLKIKKKQFGTINTEEGSEESWEIRSPTEQFSSCTHPHPQQREFYIEWDLKMQLPKVGMMK